MDTCFRYLALICSSLDLKLDHLCLEPEMKGVNRLLVLRDPKRVGMGFSFLCVRGCECMCLGNIMHFDTCVRVRVKVVFFLNLATDCACHAEDKQGRLFAYAAACPQAVERPPLITAVYNSVLFGQMRA